MFKDRVIIFGGGAIAIVSAALLLLCGNSLVAVFSVLTEPRKGIINDLGITVLATAGLGVGMCLVAYAFRQARQLRTLTTPYKAIAMLASALTSVGGVLLFIEFRELTQQFDAIAAGTAMPDPKLVAIAISDGSDRATYGFFTILSGQILLGISLWSMFWSESAPEPRRTTFSPLLLATLLCVLGFSSLLILAAKSGGHAIELVRVSQSVKPGTLAKSLNGTLVYASLAAGCLVVYGGLQTVLALLFPLDSNG